MSKWIMELYVWVWLTLGVSDTFSKSHTSVVDKDGMAVALTSTVNLIFGSQVLDPETGVILNNEVACFASVVL